MTENVWNCDIYIHLGYFEYKRFQRINKKVVSRIFGPKGGGGRIISAWSKLRNEEHNLLFATHD
jgi:hypothetical protein